MGSNWLFLRGEWDERTQKSIDDDDDMWLQLFKELGGKNHTVFFSDDKRYYDQYDNYNIVRGKTVYDLGYDIVFSRGGFSWQSEICKKYHNAFKIRYGAGRRFMPESDINYDLILVDSEKQKQDVLSVFPKANVHLWIKPAAKHFRYMPEVEKEYDVCYIANGQQAHFKGVEWTYETCPKDLKILHLGYPSKHKVPENVTQIRVDRINMPEWINKCRVGIVPYFNQIDSCPRVIPEMLACGLPLIVSEELNFLRYKYLFDYIGATSDKIDFWNDVNVYNLAHKNNNLIHKHYQDNLSLSVSANHIKQLIKECKK